VFLNNDTVPRRGWLEALVEHAERHPVAGVVGSKLVYPNDTVQHAGVVICQDGNPRHLYAGFPAEHPAVNRTRRFQAVTAGCALVRRRAFEQARGFDTVFRNCLEDADLCLRLGELGWEVWYCHASVLVHLESVSRGRRSRDIERNAKIFRGRWSGRVPRDDLHYYREDALLKIRYTDSYPVGVELAPEVAVLRDPGRAESRERVLDERSRQVAELLRETVRLTAQIAQLEERGRSHAGQGPGVRASREPGVATAASGAAKEAPSRRSPVGSPDISALIEEIELRIHDLQSAIAAAARAGNGAPVGERTFEPSTYLAYRELTDRLRRAAEEAIPAGSTVLVVSKGDDGLLELGQRSAWHFPREADGTYAGHYPADGAAAVDHLEELRALGADYLLLPATSLWWLTEYSELREHLEQRYRPVLRDPDTAVIYELRARR
jgi:hypothetical protein